MKALIQRVMNAKVTVDDEVISTIRQGICVFIGICCSDTVQDMEYIARKILNMKLFDDVHDKSWKRSVMNREFEVLCVSQFTLYNTWQGNKPDFRHAMPAEQSKELYEKFLQTLRDSYKSHKIKDGCFGAYMQVSIENDGPATFLIESPGFVAKSREKKNTPAVATKAQGGEHVF